MNAEKLQDVQQKLEAFLAQEKEQKERAQRCFVSYLRSVYLMKNKEVFDVFKLKTNEYALSLGLAVAPRVRFLNKAQTQRAKLEAQTPEEQLEEEEELSSFKAQLRGTAPQEQHHNSESEDSSEDEESDSEEPVRKPSQKSESEEEEEDDDDDLRDLDLLTVKRKDIFNIEGDDESTEEPEQSKQAPKKNVAKDSKFKEAKKVLKRKFQVNTKVTFSEGGEAVQLWPPVQRLATAQEEDEDDEVSGINVEKAKERLKREDQEFDKQEYRRKVKAKHRESRLKAKAARREAKKKSGRKSDDDDGDEEEEEVVAYLDKNSEDEFDPSMLPDPDKLYSKDDEEGEEEEERRRSKRQHSRESSDEDEPELAAGNRKRAKQVDEEHTALDTGLSLAEDEELVLHLLGGSR